MEASAEESEPQVESTRVGAAEVSTGSHETEEKVAKINTIKSAEEAALRADLVEPRDEIVIFSLKK